MFILPLALLTYPIGFSIVIALIFGKMEIL